MILPEHQGVSRLQSIIFHTYIIYQTRPVIFIQAKLSSEFMTVLQSLLSLYGIVYFYELNWEAIF